ncbi:MAG: CpaF family protein [Bradymonadia bacterium]
MNRAELKRSIRDRLFRDRGGGAGLEKSNRAELRRELEGYLKRVRGVRLDAHERERMLDEIVDDLIGYGPLSALLQDGSVTEIMVNGPKVIYVERNGIFEESKLRFDDDHHLKSVVQRMARVSGRRVDESSPCADLHLEDGTRVNVVYSPIAVGGPFVTLRKPGKSMAGLEELMEVGTLDVAMARFLWACVQAGINMLISGATGAGKTTLMEVLSAYIDERERIITIEDNCELRLRQQHVVRMETRNANIEGKGEVTLRDLFVNSLRMRPHRIILGEIRGPEAFDYLQALTSGHRGSMAVIHAASPQEVVLRLENLVHLAGRSVPPMVVRNQIVQGLELVIQLTQLSDGTRRVTQISEIMGLDEDGLITLRDIFRFEETGSDREGRVRGRFLASGDVPFFFDRFERLNLEIDETVFQGR